jgi:hypothetical protein
LIDRAREAGKCRYGILERENPFDPPALLGAGDCRYGSSK